MEEISDFVDTIPTVGADSKMPRPYSKFDPYPKFMHRFFTEIALAKPEQGAYLTEYSYPELKKFFVPMKDKEGNFMGFLLKDKLRVEYLAARKKLNII